jgi:hypothetical protein
MMAVFWRSLSRSLLAIAAVAALVATQAHAQSETTTTFNHFSTGFPLTGTHMSVSCPACHVNGRFKNTPKQCIGCHNTMTAPGEPQSHPRTTNRCESCHLTTTWRDLRFIDHVQAIGSCASCHNGKLAVGKNATHIITAAPCGTCHFNTVTFAGARVPAEAPGSNAAVTPATPKPPTAPAAGTKTTHTGVIDKCASCHNGGAAPGKSQNHVATSAPCETCHKSTVTFAGARMNHAGLTANCIGCHNGKTATGRPANHIATTAPCATCHKSTMSFVGARVDHAGVTASCVSCHNGNTADGKPTQHLLTASPCDTCHRTVTWTPVVYRHISPAFVNHGPGVACAGCHVANAQMVVWKFPAFRPNCAGCHADKYRPMSHPKFQRPATVYYTGAELRDCTGACHLYTDNMQRTIQTRRSGMHRAIGGGW